jgi:hypothetical protein
MNNRSNPIQFRTSQPRVTSTTEPEPSAFGDDLIPPDCPAAQYKDPYLRLMVFMHDSAFAAIAELRKDKEELHSATETLRAEVDRLRQENKELREAKAAIAENRETRGRVAELAARVQQLDFSLTRIAADRRGEPGRDGEAGPMGPPGKDGVGRAGPRGARGYSVAEWSYDLANYKITPRYTDGKLGVAIELAPIIEQAYLDGRFSDDIAEAEAAAEESASRQYLERLARFRGG